MYIEKQAVTTIKDVIVFKSTPAMFIRERSGAKSNTIRTLTLKEYDIFLRAKPQYLKIIELNNISNFFIREIKDTIDFVEDKYGDRVILFSWG
jgi:hypothetical protein